MKKSAKCKVYIALYVDDNSMWGNPGAIVEAIKALQKHELLLKVMEGLQEYLSCEVEFSTDERRAC